MARERQLTFSIRSEVDAQGQVVVVSGEADMTAAAHLEQAIREATRKASVVIVDLSESSFIDSSTIGVLVNWTELLHASRGRLPIVCTNPNMLRVFKQIGLGETLQIVASRSAATPAG